MKHTLTNAYHPEITTTVRLSLYQEQKRKESGQTVWDYIQCHTTQRRIAAILHRMDNSQAEAITEVN